MAAGAFVYPVVLESITRNYGYTGHMLTWAACSLQVCVAGALCRPMADNFRRDIEEPSIPMQTIGNTQPEFQRADSFDLNHDPENESLIDKPIEKNWLDVSYITVVVAVFLGCISYVPAVVFNLATLEERGEASWKAASTISWIGIADFIPRVLFGIHCDRKSFRPYWIYCFDTLILISAASCFGLAFTSTVTVSYVLFGFIGVCHSNISSLALVIIGDIMKGGVFGPAISALSIGQGVALIISSIVAGEL